ncbi:HMGL-like-domain-containing protein [Ustulina deusta]|nr:HMGL-like-domain-containing protein [Ustulina deusta]
MAYIAAKAKDIIEYVKSEGREVRFSGEDSFRSDFSRILNLYSLVDSLGANRVGIADTVGGATPMEVFDKIAALREVVSCDIETYFHNDIGCAIAYAYTALEAGATYIIDTTVLGIGERNGIELPRTVGRTNCLGGNSVQQLGVAIVEMQLNKTCGTGQLGEAGDRESHPSPLIC